MTEESIRRGLNEAAQGEVRRRDDLLPPTLTEFLLARIAEDEAEAKKWAEREVRWPSRRMLAECEAKREILKRHVILEAASDSEPESVELAWHAQGALEAALVVAAIYADHPDYREEWKP